LPPKEIDNTDRVLIDRYISLLYAQHYIKSDKEKAYGSVTKVIAIALEEMADKELFNVRRQMRDRGIIIKNTSKGVFDAKVRGYDHQVVINAEMAKAKAEKVMKDLLPDK
jgi:hypothetical protein